MGSPIVRPWEMNRTDVLHPIITARFLRTHLGALSYSHPPHWIGSIEIIDRSGWTREDRRAFDRELGDTGEQLAHIHRDLCEVGYPKQEHHVRVIIEEDVMYFEDEQGRIGQSFFALHDSPVWPPYQRHAPDDNVYRAGRGTLYSEGNPHRRHPNPRWDGHDVCPWLWYTP